VAVNDNGQDVPPAEQTAPPAGGWELPREEAAAAADVLTQLSDLLQEFVPEDLQKRIAEAMRELLVALRALIDWLVDRLERRPGQPTEIRDIPIL
jgi:hypothetical protein